MKILYLVIDGKISGGNQICAAILRAACQAGHQVELVTSNLGPLTESLAREGVKIHLLDLAHSFYVHRVLQLVFLLRRRRIDLVHTHTSLVPEILCRLACFLARVPIICHQHEPTDVYNKNPLVARYQRWLDRATSKLVSQFVAVSKCRLDVMIQERGYPKDKVELIYNGIEVHRFKRADGRQVTREAWGIQSDEVAIGLIARLEPAKGQETLIEAVPLVLQKFPHAKFFIVGDDPLPDRPYRFQCQELIRNLGVDRNCFLLGAKEEVHKWIQGLDLVVLPSWWEGHPLVLLEAMAAGKPVIASKVGGTPEIVEHERDGFLIPPRNPKALADAICRLIESSEWGERMAQCGYQKVAEQFDQKRMIDQTLSLYDRAEVSSPNVNFLSLRGAKRRSNPGSEIASPHKAGLAMTTSGKLQNAVVLALAMGFVFIGLEVALRVRSREFSFENYLNREVDLFRSAYPTQYDSILGWIPKVGASGKANVWKTTVTIEENGIRSNGQTVSSSASHLRPILAVGDSFTFGDEVSDRETWPAILESLLQRQVINGGVFGYGLDQSFLRAKQLIELSRPDTLIFSFSEDDIWRCEFSERTGVAKPYFKMSGGALQLEHVPVLPPRIPKPMGKFRRTFGYSFLVHRVMMKFFPHHWMQGQSHNTKIHSEGQKVGCLLLKQIDDIAREFEVEHVYVMAQYSKAPSEKEITTVAQVMDCVDPSVRVIDLGPALLEVKQRDQKAYNRLFKFHMTREGNYFVAHQLQMAMSNWLTHESRSKH